MELCSTMMKVREVLLEGEVVVLEHVMLSGGKRRKLEL
jgi:hypothetical protein